jgi:hypothetical protein
MMNNKMMVALVGALSDRLRRDYKSCGEKALSGANMNSQTGWDFAGRKEC